MGTYKGGGHTRRPHERFGGGAHAQHRDLVRPHAEKREVLKDPANSPRPALGIGSSAHCIKQKTTAHQSPDQPVRNRVRGEVKKNPRKNDSGYSDGGGMGRPKSRQCKIRSHYSG